MFTIERATVEEVDPIKQVLSETWVATYADHLSRSTIEQVSIHWHNPALLRSQIERTGDYFGVAKDEGSIVALITINVVNRGELHLSRLYVRPDYQGKGIGTRLLHAAIASYPDASVIRLEVEEQNAKGHSYWLRKDFVVIGTRTVQIGTDRIAVITMERKLR